MIAPIKRALLCPPSNHAPYLVRPLCMSVGGYDGAQQLRSVIRYNPVYDEWHEVASMLVARSVVSCVTYMGKIYAFGGFAGVDTLDSAEVYETETNTWRAIAPMPRKRRRHACAELGGYIYVVGGENGLLITNDVFRYNPRDDTWTSVASMVTQRYGHACAVLGDKLIAVGGYDGAEQLRSAEQYDSLTDQWVPMPQMNTWRAYAACGVLMGQIFVTGVPVCLVRTCLDLPCNSGSALPISFPDSLPIADIVGMRRRVRRRRGPTVRGDVQPRDARLDCQLSDEPRTLRSCHGRVLSDTGKEVPPDHRPPLPHLLK